MQYQLTVLAISLNARRIGFREVCCSLFACFTLAFLIGSLAVADAAVLSNGTAYDPPFGGDLCADVSGANPAAGTPVQTWTCHGGLNQQFSLLSYYVLPENNGSLAMTIFAMGGSMCLGVNADLQSIFSGAGIVLRTCDNNAAIWQYVGGQIQLIGIQGGGFGLWCLDSGGTTIGVQLTLTACGNSPAQIPSQQWQIK